jgi:hypothetical protein
MTTLAGGVRRFAWLNFMDGGRTKTGEFDFARLHRLVAPLNDRQPGPGAAVPAAVVAVCEAKEWGAKGNDGLFTAAQVLSETLGRAYVGKLCSFDRGPIGPALFFDPTLVRPVEWHDDNGYPDYVDKSDLARFQAVGTDRHFVVIVRHLAPLSPQQRKEEVRLLGRYGDGFPAPVTILGDLNSCPSGPWWPRRDWTKASYRDRDAKAVRLPDGTWVDATDAIDHLIGWWNEGPHDQGRVDGCGFWAIPEIAYATGTPIEEAFRATVNRGIDAGGGQLIDHCLVNRPHLYVPGTYRIHIPPHRDDGRWDSDHRLGEATFDLSAEPGSTAYLDADLARSYRLAGEPR